MSAPVQVVVDKCPSADLATTNHVYMCEEDVAALDATRAVNDETAKRYVEIKGIVFTYDSSRKMKKGHLGLTKEQRRVCSLALNDPLSLTAFEIESTDACLAELELSVDFLSKAAAASKAAQLSFEVDELCELVREAYVGQFMTTSQSFVLVAKNQNLRVDVLRCGVVSDEVLTKIAEGATIEAHTARRGVLMNGTRILLQRAPESALKLAGAASGAAGGAGLLLDWDFEKMGIGGLDHEFNAIFRRAFASRIYPPAVIAKLGITHVRGILLYGPPGTGKTLMARQIGKMLNGREPKVVSGPEILNKFVGQSEENVRKLFQEAEEEQRKRGLDSDLHIIILDELDAICRARGSRNDSTGVGDTVVNQLLAKIDGVDSLNNILVIGMTNRKELIDPALLRPGRLEVHMEISLPNEEGRVQILNIHTRRMRENKFLDETKVDLVALAKRMKNYSGAEIEAIVKAATSWAMRRQVDVKNLKKAPKEEELQLLPEDFERAMTEVRPAFGVSKEDFDGAVPNGVVPFGERFVRVHNTAHLFVEQVRKSERTPLVTLLLAGERGCGKTALAATLAITSNYPFVKLVSPEQLVGLSEAAKVMRIAEAFDGAYKSPLSVLVLDDLERMIEYVGSMPARFSNQVLQALAVLLGKRPPKAHRLLVIGTTSNLKALKELALFDAFNAHLVIPSIESRDELRRFVSDDAVKAFDDEQALTRVVQAFPAKGAHLPVKKAIMMIEMARQGAPATFIDRLETAMKELSLQ